LQLPTVAAGKEVVRDELVWKESVVVWKEMPARMVVNGLRAYPWFLAAINATA
jgi:hypothetical protein